MVRPESRLSWSSLTWLLGAWPVLVAAAGTAVAGSLSIPHNDDWSYVKTARILAETGNLELQGWAGTSLLGQVFLAYPFLRIFGSSVVVLNLGVALVSLAGLGATYAVFARFVTTRAALLGTLVMSLFPGYLLLSTSFMTDIPGYTAMALCLAAGLRALDRRSLAWFWGALALGAVGVSIRYQAAAAPLAVLFSWALFQRQAEGRPRPWHTALAGGLIFAAFVAAFMRWRLALPGAEDASASTLHLVHVAESVLRAFPFLGLALLPLTALCLDRLFLVWRRPGALLLATASAVGFGLMHYKGRELFPGNYLDRFGPYLEAAYGSTPVVSLRVWQALETLGWVAGTVALLVLLYAVPRPFFARLRTGWNELRSDRAPTMLLSAFAMLYAGILVAPTLIGWPIFDRYLLPLMLPAGLGLLVLAGRASRRAACFSWASVGVLVVLAMVLTTVSAQDDSMRWQVSAQLVREGASPTDVSSGLEWQGTFAAHPALTARMRDLRPADQFGLWTRVFAGRDCWFITRDPESSSKARLIQTHRYTRFPGLRGGALYVYRTDFCS